jgi:polyisoprenoid-binding protein YceI
MSIVSLVIAPYISVNGDEQLADKNGITTPAATEERKDIGEIKGEYAVDGAHSSVVFSIKHIIMNTRGAVPIDSGFMNLQSTMGPKIYVRMDMAKLNTQNSKRDEHLNSASFFETSRYKSSTFEASEIIKNPDSSRYDYLAKGKFTMKGTTKQLDIPFNFTGSGRQEYTDDKNLEHKMEVIGFRGEAMLNPNDFGIKSSSDEVKIEIDLEAYRERSDW